MSYNNQERIKGILEQMHSAILDLKEWNKDIVSSEDYYCSPDGMKNLAAKVQCSNLKVPNWWFGCIWLHFSVLIVAIN